MKIVRRPLERHDAALTMSSMIDVVFLLLIFFVMTFRVVLPEGDLHLNLPAAAAEPVVKKPPLREEFTIFLRMTAGDDGSLEAIRLNGQPLEDFDQLRAKIRRLVSVDDGVELAIEFDVDRDLDYRHVVAAITAVGGFVNQQGEVMPLIQKIRFAPRATLRR